VEFVFVVLIGALLGLVARVVLPRRDSLGVGLLPAIGGCAGAIVWAALTWARLPSNPLTWSVTIAAELLSVVAAGLLVGRAREREDRRTFDSVARGA
jgi:uncharacterized membrane protein YeaQ/YmgE (transglycosylase-associated protein family)